MATSTLTVSSAFTRTNALQPDQSTPVGIPVFSDSTPTQVFQQELLLPAAGVSVPLSGLIPTSWTTITQVQVVNIDSTGYISIALNATSGAPAISLQPAGGTIATSLYATTISGGVPANTRAAVGSWTLKSMSSDGTTAGAAATKVYLYVAGI